MMKANLCDVYRDYIACLNKQDWPKLEQFVHDEVYYNDRLLIFDPPHIASRLGFNCTPKGKFLGLHINGKRVSFTENVFYKFRGEKIEQVWSIIDKAAIEAQL